MSEVRLVAMKVAGTYSRGGVKLVPCAPDHRTAWGEGITEEEGEELRHAADAWGVTHKDGSAVTDKLTAAFNQESERSR